MRICATSYFVLFLFILTQVSSAQVTRVSNEQQGKFFDGILKTLVNSQNNFNGQQPLSPVPQTNQSPEVRQAQKSISDFAAEAGQLITALRYEERYSQHARGLLGEALRIKAVADVLLTRSRGISEVHQLSTEYAELNRQWHLLSHQIQQNSNLSNTVMQRVSRLDQLSTTLEQQLNLHPQMDKQALIYYFAALGEDLNRLVQDLQIDLSSHPNREQFATSILQLRTKAQRLRMAVEYDYRYDDVAQYYKNFHQEWLAAKGDLRSVNNRYIQRSISRVSEINNRISELLWLPPVIDGRDILYQADLLKQQVNTTANQISMKELIEQPNSSELFEKSREFYAMCNDFRNTVATETQLDNLRWDFRGLEVAWEDIKQALNPLRKQETIQNVAAIESSIAQLRNDLGMHDTVDSNQAIELVSTLFNMSDLLYYDVARFVGQSSRVPPQLRNQTIQLADQFRKSAQRLRQSMSQPANSQEIQGLARQLSQQWSDLEQYIAQIPYELRQELSRPSQEIAPAIAKLQVMYAAY